MLGRSRWGEEVLPGVLTVLGCGVWPASCRVRVKKIRTCRCDRRNYAGAAAGVRSITSILLPFLTNESFRRQQVASRRAPGYRYGTAIRASDAVHDADPARPPPLRTPPAHQPARP